MNRAVPVIFVILLVSLSALHAQSASSQSAPSVPASGTQLAGIWENRSRFVEFAADSRMRIVLKPYYGFVYEDTGWIPFSLTASADPADTSPYLYRVAVRYTGEKADQLVPAAIIGNGLFVGFYRRFAETAAGDTGATASDTILNGAGIIPAATTGMAVASPSASATSGPLSGFWMAAGNAAALRLYKSDPVNEFYCYCFSGGNYYRIRYWADDVRFKDLRATFTGKDGSTLSVPKFIHLGDVLYTCITSTGVMLRNYESGTYALKDGLLTLKPDRVMYKGTEAGVSTPVRCTVSPDGSILALGEPYLSRSKVVALDAEITAHNGLRRPARKPVFGYMDLDFHWDEIDALRGTDDAATAATTGTTTTITTPTTTTNVAAPAKTGQ